MVNFVRLTGLFTMLALASNDFKGHIPYIPFLVQTLPVLLILSMASCICGHQRAIYTIRYAQSKEPLAIKDWQLTTAPYQMSVIFAALHVQAIITACTDTQSTYPRYNVPALLRQSEHSCSMSQQHCGKLSRSPLCRSARPSTLLSRHVCTGISVHPGGSTA